MQPLSSQTNDLQRISLYMYQRLLCFATPLLLNFESDICNSKPICKYVLFSFTLAIWKYCNTQRKICASIIEIFDTVDSPMWTSHSCKYLIYLVQSWFCKILVCMRRYCITSNKIDLNLHVFTIISIISSI